MRKYVWLRIGFVILNLLVVRAARAESKAHSSRSYVSRSAASYLQRGNESFSRGELDRAIADYNLALRFNPEFGLAYYNRGVTLAVKGDLDAAFADYSRAIELDARNGDAYTQRGVIQYRKGDLDRAIADYTRAAEISPSRAEIYFNSGLAHEADRDSDRALADYDKAIQLNRKFADAYYSRGRLSRRHGRIFRCDQRLRQSHPAQSTPHTSPLQSRSRTAAHRCQCFYCRLHTCDHDRPRIR